jgi:tripartite-type tricarboxylate transporter receptor subunit TctC
MNMTPINKHKRGALRNLIIALSSVACLGAASLGHAQTSYPNRAIRLIVPFVPGGVADTGGRLIADALSKRTNQQIIVENKPGASGNIGTTLVANAEPDGYTILLGFDGTLVINPHVFAKMTFDSVKDFAPIGKIGDAATILVANPKVPVKTLMDVINLSKTSPNGLEFGTSGIGGTPHLAGERLNQITGSKLVHVPYKGGGQALIDVQGGTIPLVYTAVAGAYQHIQNGTIIAIAVSSAERVPSLPNVPTFVESGVPGFVVDSWIGLLAPAKTPQPIVNYLNKELNAALSDPEVKAKLEKLGIIPVIGSPEQFGKVIKDELQQNGAIVKAANIKLE